MHSSKETKVVNLRMVLMTPDQLAAHKAKYAAERIRKGKTQRDRASQASARGASNRDQRASWQNGRRSDGSNSTAFPAHTCNGQRNRYQVTGKGGAVVHLKHKK